MKILLKCIINNSCKDVSSDVNRVGFHGLSINLSFSLVVCCSYEIPVPWKLVKVNRCRDERVPSVVYVNATVKIVELSCWMWLSGLPIVAMSFPGCLYGPQVSHCHCVFSQLIYTPSLSSICIGLFPFPCCRHACFQSLYRIIYHAIPLRRYTVLHLLRLPLVHWRT